MAMIENEKEKKLSRKDYRLMAAELFCVCLHASPAYTRLVASLSYMDLNEGLGAYDQGDIETALREFRDAANRGNRNAQFLLGVIYKEGLGIPQDVKEALYWYCRAADAGCAGAQLNLGALYANGVDIPQDWPEAVRLYRRAAEAGHIEAQAVLGEMYAKGEGIEKDLAEAYKWFSLSHAATKPVILEEFERDFAMSVEDVAEGQRRAQEWRKTFVPGIS